jgi:alpha-tubulin suppressor-like RCC1 family protein
MRKPFLFPIILFALFIITACGNPITAGNTTAIATVSSYGVITENTTTPSIFPSSTKEISPFVVPTATSFPKTNPTALTAFGKTACTVTNHGGVRCWEMQEEHSRGTYENEPPPSDIDVVPPIPYDINGLTTGIADVQDTCSISTGGEIYCWDPDFYYLMPQKAFGVNDSKQILRGSAQSCYLSVSGIVKCWIADKGDSESSLFTKLPTTLKGLPNGIVSLSYCYNGSMCAITSDGKLFRWDHNDPPEYDDEYKTKVVAVDAGYAHECAIVANGGVKCWGWSNYSGQLGNGKMDPGSFSPVDVVGLDTGIVQISVGSSHTCALSVSGGVVCWGNNEDGQLGDGTTENRSAPVPVIGLEKGVQNIASGDSFSCALLSSGSVKCWGFVLPLKAADQNNPDDDAPIEIHFIEPVLSVYTMAVGYSHACAIIKKHFPLLNDHYLPKIKCWGKNDNGQLGDGTLVNRLSPVDVLNIDGRSDLSAETLAAGKDHTCGLSTGGRIFCWGSNDSGQLGDGSTVDKEYPVLLEGFIGSYLVAGGDHTCSIGGLTVPVLSTPTYSPPTYGVEQSREIWCWGSNKYGQLGDGTNIDRLTPVKVEGLSGYLSDLVLGENHTCVRLEDNSVKCWGRNNYGQLGNGTTIDSNVPVQASLHSGAMQLAAGFNHTCAWTMQNIFMECWGANQSGQLGDGTTENRLTPVEALASEGEHSLYIAAGGNATCIQNSYSGEVFRCWGGNEFGQLGDGTTLDRLNAVNNRFTNLGSSQDPTPYPGATRSGASTFLMSGGFSCVYSYLFIICWGQNSFGQLGDGTTIDRVTAALVTPLYYDPEQ